MASLLSLDFPALARAAGQVHRGVEEILGAARALAVLPEGDAQREELLGQLAARAEEIYPFSSQVAEDLASAATPTSANGSVPEPPRALPPPRLESIIMANPTGAKELILIADHEARVLRQTEAVLTEDDYRVITARDGFEAVSLYNRLWTAIDLVILDFALPGMSGDLIFDELLGINPNVPVVVSSGFHQPAKLSAMLAKGLCGFLPKPYDRDKLLKQVQAVLAHRRR